MRSTSRYGQDQLLLDERPDDPGHLVAVELDDRVGDFDLRVTAFGGRDAIDARMPVDGNRRATTPGAPTRSSTSRPPWSTTTSSRPTPPLREAVRREGADWAEARISAVGELAGAARTIELGVQANENPPKLKTHDRFGNRVDEVEFHPAWHELLGLAVEHELHASPWKDPRPGAHVARAAAFMCMSQAEAGIGCPISMTYSVVPALRVQPDLAAEWEPRFLSNSYDPTQPPGAGEARGAGRDGNDREAGRHRRPRQHHGRAARSTAAGRAPSTS